VYAKDKAALFN